MEEIKMTGNEFNEDFEKYVENMMDSMMESTIILPNDIEVECKEIDNQYFASCHVTGKKVESDTSKYDDCYNALSIGGHRITKLLNHMAELGFEFNSISTFDRERDPITMRMLFVS